MHANLYYVRLLLIQAGKYISEHIIRQGCPSTHVQLDHVSYLTIRPMERGRSPTREEELQASQALLLLGAAVEGPVPSAHVQVDVVPNLDAFRAGRISEKKALRALLPLPRPAHLCPNIVSNFIIINSTSGLI